MCIAAEGSAGTWEILPFPRTQTAACSGWPPKQHPGPARRASAVARERRDPMQPWYRLAKENEAEAGWMAGSLSVRVVPMKPGQRHSTATRRREGGRLNMESFLGTTTDASKSGYRIHETGTDSNAGETIAADGFHVPGVSDGLAVAAGSLPPHPQERGGGRGRPELARVRAEPGGQPPGAAGPRQVVAPTAPHRSNVSTSPKRAIQRNSDRSASRRWRTRSSSGRWSCCWSRSTSRTSSWLVRLPARPWAHQALEELWKGMMDTDGGWVLEVDISKFFDTLDHGHLRRARPASSA